jgi:hypothetical protein
VFKYTTVHGAILSVIAAVLPVSLILMIGVSANAQSAVKLLPDDAAQWDDFGHSVAISNDRILIGAPYCVGHLPRLLELGTAYIFVRSEEGWRQEAKLMPSYSHAMDNFGYSVDLEGAVAVVGAPTDAEVPLGEGKAFIFRRSGDNWTEEALLSYPNSFRFGRTVAISGNTVAVAAHDEVHVYQKLLSGWTLQYTIESGEEWSYVTSLALEDDYLLIGTLKGVFPFHRNGTEWDAEEPFDPQNSKPSGMYGYQVAISGSWVIVGARDYEDDPDHHWGAVTTFKRTGDSWVRNSKIIKNTPYDPIWFGSTVDIDADYLVAGADGSREVFIFRLLGNTWEEVGDGYTHADIDFVDRFGYSVAIDRGGRISEGTVVAGAPALFLDEPGAAYVFEGLIPPTFSSIDPERFQLLARLLIGVAEGGEGWIWVPGEGPIPIDPDPLKFLRWLSPTERDVVIGLAVRELAAMTSDNKMQSALEAAGNQVMSDALQKLKVERPK